MGVQNTEKLLHYIIEENIEDKADNIKRLINVFSEYLVAVNPDYVYNKTYMSAFVDDFITCQKHFKTKYQILKKIIIMLLTQGMDVHNFTVCIDSTWIYRNGKIELANVINPDYVKRNKIQIELEFLADKGFVIAEELDTSEEYSETLEACVSEFNMRREEVLNDKV